jgi:hypothetical protein
MPRRIRSDFEDSYEMRNAEVRVARLPRPCDAVVCARNGVMITEGTPYAYVNTGLAFCPYHWKDSDVVEVSR